MRKLSEGDLHHDGHLRVIHLLDFFVHEGPNGQHACLVYKAMGESVSRFQTRFPNQRLPLKFAKRLARQILQAIDYIHSCGIIHTGKSSHRSLYDFSSLTPVCLSP